MMRKSHGEWRRNNELVMHMSNLPAFLQNVKEDSVQGKALSFGVLDWKRLEKWKDSTGGTLGKASSSGKSSICSTDGEAAKLDFNMRSHPFSTLQRQSSRFGSYVTNVSECRDSNEYGTSYESRLDGVPGKRFQNDAAFQADCPKEQHHSDIHEVKHPRLMMRGKAVKPSFCIEESVSESDFSGDPCTKGRASGLFRKVRFSLGRLSKSSSFRESSSLTDFDTSGSSTAERRLWRILDPISKRTTAQTKHTVSSKVRALLQLTLKNEVPFYKLVVETSNSMLVAAATISEKTDPTMTYTFYSVSDFKKKSMNWKLTKGSSSNNKSSSLAYNIIGHMKIEAGKTEANESTLYGLKNEIAAIITDTSTVVVLPAAEHGMPIKGAPSSLISRWRSGGSCDCGAWDIGCKLRVLDEHQQPKSSILKLYSQGREENEPVFAMEALKTGLYSVVFDNSVPMLEAFGICVAQLTLETCRFVGSDVGVGAKDEPERFRVQQQCSMKYGTSCPPLSPAGRI